MPPVSDAELIARVVVVDDRHAFSELVRRHQSAVRATLRRLTAGNFALADDLAQDTFMLAYRNIKSFRQEAKFSTWLYRIATNAFLADALGALAGGNPAAALSAGPATAPLYEQAKQIRRRAAWSDLRKGVILAGFGLGLTFFSIFDDGTPNSVGLVLLFVGIGYLVLWWFEERQLAPTGKAGGSVPPVGPPAGTNGSA